MTESVGTKLTLMHRADAIIKSIFEQTKLGVGRKCTTPVSPPDDWADAADPGGCEVFAADADARPTTVGLR